MVHLGFWRQFSPVKSVQVNECSQEAIIVCCVAPFSVPPEVLPFWFPKEVTVGQLIQISCTAMGDDPITLQWYKDDMPLMSSAKFIINKVDDKLSNLVLRGVMSEHSGKYACAAFNPVGEARYEKELRVKGKERNLVLIYCFYYCMQCLCI